MKAVASFLLALATVVSLPAQWSQMIYDQGTALTELNMVDEYDGAPWISGDGLRIYYVGAATGTLRLTYAQRSSLLEPFGTPTAALPDTFPEASSCWLTPDELGIYFVGPGPTLYHATRASIDADFDPPVPVTLNGVPGPFHSPSLTPDEQEMALGSDVVVLHLQRVGAEEYTVIDSILAYAPGDVNWTTPGHFDATGLAYYCARWMDGPSFLFLARCYRSELGEPFSSWSYLSGEAQLGGDHYNPAVVTDSSLIVYTRVGGPTFDDYDLYVASATNVGMHEVDADAGILVQPTITSGAVELFLLAPGAVAERVRLFAMDGTLAGAWRMPAPRHMQLNLSAYPAGSYVLHVEGEGAAWRAPVVLVH